MLGRSGPRSARSWLAHGTLALALLFSGDALAAPRGNSAATTTGAFADSCHDFAAHSNQDISHVEIHYVDGRVVRDETTTTPGYAIDGGPSAESWARAPPAHQAIDRPPVRDTIEPASAR